MPINIHRLIAVLCVLLSSAIQGYSQIILTGKVTADNENLAFANVALFIPNDSTSPLKGALTDLTGEYKIVDLKPGKYLLKITCPGHLDADSIISLRMPSGGNVVVRNFNLKVASQQLNEVIVTANRSKLYADHTRYAFTADQYLKARHSADLLINVGDLTIDPVSGKLSKLSGGSVNILINGVVATITDLKSIPPDKIKYAEYYTLPSARYSSTAAVVNIVTKSLDNGLNGGIDISHALTTGFCNDDIFIRATKGHNQLVVNYSVYYRNYKNRFVKENYAYSLPDNDINYRSMAHSKFGYATHVPEMKYIYSKPQSTTIQVSLNPEYETRFDNYTSNISIQGNGVAALGLGAKNTKAYYVSPALDVYASKQFNDSSEIGVNIVATYYKSNLNSKVAEAFNTPAFTSFNDEMSRETQKKSLIGELFYAKKIGLNSITGGYKLTTNQSIANGKNLLTDYMIAAYKSRYSTNYMYGEYSGVYRTLMYRLSLGGTLVNSSTSHNSYQQFYTTPQLVLNWNISGKNHLAFSAKTTPIIPTLTQLSNNAEHVTSHLIHTGNPMLKSGLSSSNVLGYRYFDNTFDLSAALTCNVEANPIEVSYTSAELNGQNYIIAKEQNAKTMLQYGGIFRGNLRLFSNKINLRLIAMAIEQSLRSRNNSVIRNLYMPMYLQLAYTATHWGVDYHCSIPAHQIEASSIVTDENVSSLNAYYQYKQFRITASCLWLFTKSKYRTQLLNNDLISHTQQSWINDNQSMVLLGFSWNFSRGKNRDINKKLNNADTDKGVF